MTLTPRLKELKHHALRVANRLNHLLNTNDPNLAQESAKARSRHTPESAPTKLYSEYPPSEGESCPECWVSVRGIQLLVLEAETDSTDILKCPKCGFMPELLKNQS